jgi:hypothetical protein
VSAYDLRVLSCVPGQFYEVTQCLPGGPVGRAAKRGDGRFSAFLVDTPDDRQVFDTFDEAVEAARSLIGDPQ